MIETGLAAANVGPALLAASVDKSFGDVRVLHGVHLQVEPGQVHALLGENGAGKSTLIRIVAGVLRPDAGRIEVGDAVGPFGDPRQAERNGVATLHQEVAVVPGLSVAENVMLGRPTPNRLGFVSWKALRREVEAIFHQLGYPMRVERDAATLGPIERTMTLLARALSLDARLLILDEPTAALTDSERRRLFAAIGRATGLGMGVLYVSHRLDEVFEIADRYTVLRNGRVVETGAVADTTTAGVVTAMTGASIDAMFPDPGVATDEPAMTVRQLNGRRLRDVDLDVARGEIVGVAGLAGSGRSELLRILGGAQRRRSGTVTVGGARGAHGALGALLDLRRPGSAQRHGVVMVPEDRHRCGLITDTAERNLNATTIGRHRAVGPLVTTAGERRHAEGLWRRLGVRGSSVRQPVFNLSGGNQQKIVLAKFIALEPAVVLLDEPTSGVDVGTKAEIYRIVANLAASGAAVLVVSSELIELLGLCHRIVVLHRGRLVADVPRADFDEHRILSACFGEGPARVAG